MIENKTTIKDRGLAITLSVLMVLSMVAVGAAAIAPAAAQQVDSVDRTAEATEVQPGQTVNITVDVTLQQADSFEIRENISEFESASIVDSDGASLSGVEGDILLASYGGPGDSDRSDVSLVYEVTIPSDAAEGDTFTLTSAEQSDIDLGSDTITVGAEEDPGTGSVTFNTQATFSTSYTLDSLSTPAVAVNASADTDSAVVVTYGSDLTIAGLDTFNASDLNGESDVIIPIQDPGGFAGEHTAHVIPTSELSSDYSPGDTVSDETAGAVLDSDSATVHQSFVDFQDQTYSGDTDTIMVDSTLSPADGDAQYSVKVHEVADDGSPGAIVGSTGVLDSGTNEDVEVSLDETLTPEDGSTDYIAMVHTEPDGAVLPHTGANGAIPGGVTDDATITVEQESATFEVSGLEADNLNFTSNAGTSAVAGTDTLEITATVTNADDFEDTQSVEFQFAGQVAASEEVNLAGGDSTTVTFTVAAPDVDAGTYTHGVFTNDDSQTAEIEILPAVNLLGSPARDTTGDGLLNDVNGDGTFNIVDVSAFLNQRDSVTDDVAAYFDYNGDGQINIVDVSRLLNILNE
jgi:hypothetical protein